MNRHVAHWLQCISFLYEQTHGMIKSGHFAHYMSAGMGCCSPYRTAHTFSQGKQKKKHLIEQLNEMSQQYVYGVSFKTGVSSLFCANSLLTARLHRYQRPSKTGGHF